MNRALQQFHKFFQLGERWRSLGLVHCDQARQMISKSKTLRMRGQGHLTEIFTRVIPLTKYRKKYQ